MVRDYEKLIRDEYNKVLKMWESGRILFHLLEFTKEIGRRAWIKKISYETLCACITASRLGIPITAPFIKELTKKGLASTETTLKTLTGYKVLEVLPVYKDPYSAYMKRYKLSEKFIKYLYTSLKDLEDESQEMC